MSRMTGLEPKTYPLDGGGWLVTCTTPGGDIHIEYDADSDVTVLWKPADGGEPIAGTVHTGPVT